MDKDTLQALGSTKFACSITFLAITTTVVCMYSTVLLVDYVLYTVCCMLYAVFVRQQQLTQSPAIYCLVMNHLKGGRSTCC